MAADGKLPTRLISKARGATNDVLTHTPSGPEWRPASGGIQFTASTTAPASPAAGDEWLDLSGACDPGPGFTATTSTDSFTGTNGAALDGRALEAGGLTWSAGTSGTISSNTAVFDSYTGALWVGAARHTAVGADVLLSSADILDVYFASDAGVDGLNDSYLMRYQAFGNYCGIYRNGAACPTTTGSNFFNIAAGGHRFEMTLVSGLLTCKIDGSTVLTYNDPTPLTGLYSGLSSPNGLGTFDNYSLTAVVARPLKLWDGTQWLYVACTAPA